MAPNDPENGAAAVVHRTPAVIHSGGKQEILDIPLFSRGILLACAGLLLEIDWTSFMRTAGAPCLAD